MSSKTTNPSFIGFKSFVTTLVGRALKTKCEITSDVANADQLVVSFPLDKEMLGEDKLLRANVKSAMISYIETLRTQGVVDGDGVVTKVPEHLVQVVDPHVGDSTVTVKLTRKSNNLSKVAPALTW